MQQQQHAALAAQQEEMARRQAALDEQQRLQAQAEEQTRRQAEELVRRQQLLDQLIAVIPMQQLQRAFEPEENQRKLNDVQAKYPQFKKTNATIYKELRALFHERY